MFEYFLSVWLPPFGSEPQGRRQAEIGDGLDCVSHPHPEKNIQDDFGELSRAEDATQICSNEANWKDESNESHPHPDKNHHDDFDKLSRAEGAIPLEKNNSINEPNSIEEHRTQNTDDRIFKASQENENCTNEANLLG